MDNNNTETKWYLEAIAAGMVFYFNNIKAQKKRLLDKFKQAFFIL